MWDDVSCLNPGICQIKSSGKCENIECVLPLFLFNNFSQVNRLKKCSTWYNLLVWNKISSGIQCEA